MQVLGLESNSTPPHLSAMQKRAAILDQILRHNRWFAKQLLHLPTSVLAEQISAHGGGEADLNLLPEQIENYVQSHFHLGRG
ncbi:MAG: hypothetical protein ABSG31_15930 [Tepidisphaeraceae bacterium]|jgi:hypothetical protein